MQRDPQKNTEEGWYIVKQEAHCQILSAADWNALDEQPLEKWGPFDSKGAAIAKRVGLIRAGKCQPV